MLAKVFKHILIYFFIFNKVRKWTLHAHCQLCFFLFLDSSRVALHASQFKIIPVYHTVDFRAGSQFLNYLKQAILHPVSVYPLLRQYIYEINQGKG